VVYAGACVVGFLMYDAGAADDEPREAAIYRFMIDRKHQGRGYGRAALSMALDEIRAIPGVRKVSISYMPDNPVAKPFYASFGFVEVGLDEDGEMLAELEL
jgi:diamine N-acetyltransferase